MANHNLTARLISRNDTAANWSAQNPVLLKGEIGVEIDTLGIKVGDGVSNWENLGYLQMGGASSSTLVVNGALFASDWVNNSQTISVEGVTATNLVIVAFSSAATDLQISEVSKCDIRCVSQTLNKVTFTCSEIPELDIPLQFIIGLSLETQDIVSRYISTSDLILNLPIEEYVEGMIVKIKYTGPNRDSGKININNLGEKNILGCLKQNCEHTLVYNGTDFVSDMFMVTIPTTGWSASAPYVNNITVLGMNNTTRAIIAPVQSENLETAKAQLESWSKVSMIDTQDNSIKVVCYEEIPTMAIPIQLTKLN